MAGHPTHPALNWGAPSNLHLRTPSMPVPNLRTATIGPNKTKAFLEIIPDQRFIVFHGNEYEAASVKLTGIVRLHTPEAMSILKPKIRLEGKRKIGWFYTTGMATGEMVDKKLFWNEEQKLGNSIESAHKIKAGVIEWPFEFDLSAAMPESVEGLYDTFIVYRLRASVARPGWNTKDVTASEHIRLVRTLGQESMEMTRSRVNTDVWANKVAYTISIPTDAVVFGTSITADLEISPLKKGIRLGKVEMRLLETVVKRIQASEYPDMRSDRSRTDESEVARADMNFPEESRIEYADETVDDPTFADEMYKFKATLPLPKSLNVCRQDVDSHQISITHRFKIMVSIHNPEGHISQLVCRLPIKIFISPNLPVDEANEVHLNGVSEDQLNSTETSAVAPPQYGRHQLDQIYGDIDASGFISRAGSGPGTPAGLMAQSRRNSQDNILSLNHIADGNHMSLHHGSATPQLLHTRLAELQVSDAGHAVRAATSANHSPSGGASPAPGTVDSQSGSRTPETSNHVHFTAAAAAGGRQHAGTSYFPSSHARAPTLSRHPSDDEVPSSATAAATYNLADLNRVPSYSSALQTPSGTVTPFAEAPPSYVDATSRPPSPLSRPAPAHLSSSSSTCVGSSSNSRTQNSPMQQQLHHLAHLPTQPQQQQHPDMHNGRSPFHNLGIPERNARFQVLDART